MSPLWIPRPKIIVFIEVLKASPYVGIVYVDPTFIEAFTTDHHFEQAGFVCLLKA